MFLVFVASALFTAHGGVLKRLRETSMKPEYPIHAPNSPIPWPYAASGAHR
jgi:hypothetical protein